MIYIAIEKVDTRGGKNRKLHTCKKALPLQ